MPCHCTDADNCSKSGCLLLSTWYDRCSAACGVANTAIQLHACFWLPPTEEPPLPASLDRCRWITMRASQARWARSSRCWRQLPLRPCAVSLSRPLSRCRGGDDGWPLQPLCHCPKAQRQAARQADSRKHSNNNACTGLRITRSTNSRWSAYMLPLAAPQPAWRRPNWRGWR